MKDNLDIEKLFKEKFENFEPNVNANAWSKISQSISSNSVSTGISVGIKTLLISASVVAVGVTTYFMVNINQQNDSIVEEKISQEKTIVKENIPNEKPVEIIAEQNDPIINENKFEIIEELTHNTNIILTEIEEKKSVDENVIEKSDSQDEANQNSVNHTNSTSVESNQIEENNPKEEVHEQLIYPDGKLELTKTNDLNQFNFKSNAVNAQEIVWDFGDGNISHEENPTHIYSVPGKYKVDLTISSQDNEFYHETKLIEILSNSSIDNIPNVITPNGDRINDEFVVNSTNIETFSISIQDQFGNVIYESKDKKFSWDGTDLSGNKVENGIYIYYIFAEGEDGTKYKIPGQIYVR